MLKRKKAFTLIEVIVSMAILGIVLVGFVTAFTQGFIMVNKGKAMTQDTFDNQEVMENDMVDVKAAYIANPSGKSYDVTIFEGDYESIVGIKEVKVDSVSSRTYLAYVTNYAFIEPLPPVLDNFTVDVYEGTSNTKLFPWYEDNIQIRADFKVKANPKIYQNRTRWYQSIDMIANPDFPSGYDVISELLTEEPAAGWVSNSLKKTGSLPTIQPGRFYYFEARPYTLSGKLAHYKNEERILVLNKAGSALWQDFIEDVYFKTAKKFDYPSATEFSEVMQNSLHPTLNVDWSTNSDPQGALMGLKVPATFNLKNIRTVVDFKLDPVTMASSPATQGVGVGLIDVNNSGLMVTINAINNTLRIDSLSNGSYQNVSLPLAAFNILENNDFLPLLNVVDGLNVMDWSKTYQLELSHSKDKSILSFRVIRKDDPSIASKLIELDISGLTLTPSYLGFKSYSSLDYKPDSRFEIIGQYDRNFAAHIYNAEIFMMSEWLDASAAGFYHGGPLGQGNSSVIESKTNSTANIKMDRTNSIVNGSGSTQHVVTIQANIFHFIPESLKLIIGNKATLSVKVHDYVWFNVPIDFQAASSQIVVSAIDNVDYPVEIFLKVGQKFTLNGGTVLTQQNGKAIILSSGTATLTKVDANTINISGALTVAP